MNIKLPGLCFCFHNAWRTMISSYFPYLKRRGDDALGTVLVGLLGKRKLIILRIIAWDTRGVHTQYNYVYIIINSKIGPHEILRKLMY